MLALTISTIITSAADSVNPIAITQQFVLQGMVKKPGHIWYFILPTGITNLIGGFLAYFGLVAFIGDFFGMLIYRYASVMFAGELALGIAFFIAALYLILRSKRKTPEKTLREVSENEGSDEADMKRKITSVSPAALVTLGIGATISELTTALPYFAFLAILFNYQLTLFQVSFILLLYNIIYTMPLVILYVIYRKSQDRFDRLYSIIKERMTKWSRILAPSIATVIGGFFIFHSITNL